MGSRSRSAENENHNDEQVALVTATVSVVAADAGDAIEPVPAVSPAVRQDENRIRRGDAACVDEPNAVADVPRTPDREREAPAPTRDISARALDALAHDPLAPLPGNLLYILPGKSPTHLCAALFNITK
jgi:hypothetical protein